MKQTNRTVLTTLAALVLAVGASLAPAHAMINLGNIGNTGGGKVIAQSPVIYPSDYRIARSMNSTTGRSTITLSWTDNSTGDVSTWIERANSAGQWVVAQQLNQPLGGPQTFSDLNMPPDSEWCYRIRITAATGAYVLTMPLCVVTQKLNDPGVWRTQLRIRVANVGSGGTDGLVSVSLNAGPHNVPTGSWTGINTPIDDLEAGSDVTYDLIQTGITTLSDITRIGVYTNSTDGFCVAQLQLLVNGVIAFDRTYGDTVTTCQWVDGDNAIFISHDELRASPLFAGYQTPVPSLVVPNDELVSRLTAIIGTLIFERTDVEWRDAGDGPGVEVSRLADDTLRSDIHLVGDGFGSPDIHLTLDTQISFQSVAGGWELVFAPAGFNASVDFPWWADTIAAIIDPVCVPTAVIAGSQFDDCMSLLEDYIAKQIENGFTAPSQRVKVALPPTCATPGVRVTTDNQLAFFCAATRTTTVGTGVKGMVGGTTKAILIR